MRTSIGWGGVSIHTDPSSNVFPSDGVGSISSSPTSFTVARLRLTAHHFCCSNRPALPVGCTSGDLCPIPCTLPSPATVVVAAGESMSPARDRAMRERSAWRSRESHSCDTLCGRDCSVLSSWSAGFDRTAYVEQDGRGSTSKLHAIHPAKILPSQLTASFTWRIKRYEWSVDCGTDGGTSQFVKRYLGKIHVFSPQGHHGASQTACQGFPDKNSVSVSRFPLWTRRSNCGTM